MLRRIYILMVSACCVLLSGAIADANQTDRPVSPELQTFWRSEVNVLLNTPLPLESQQVPGAQTAETDQLFGRKVTEVVAVAPPKGFEPVDDLGLTPGTVLTRALARQLVMRLWESGKYRDIQISGRPDDQGGVVVLIRVEPMFRISRFVITGNEALNDAEVKRAIGYSSGGTIVPDNDRMVAIRDRLLKEYGLRGFNDARASVRLETTSTVSELTLLIDVTEGEPDRYVDVRIDGLNAELHQEQLLRVSGLKGGIVRDDEAVREGLQKLSETLFELGYPDAVISDDYATKKIGANKYSLRISATPGLKTVLEFRGNKKLRTRELRELIWQQAYRSDIRGIDASVRRLKNFGTSKGLLHIRVDAYRRCHASAEKWYTVDIGESCIKPEVAWQSITYLLDEGPEVEVADVLIGGAQHFGISYLKDEIFAFMAEKNRDEAFVQPFSTQALNNVVSGDDSQVARRRTAGIGAVYSKPDTVYNPETYMEVTGHLQDLYMEQGFLKAEVADTCVIESKAPIDWKGKRYSPFVYNREDEPDDLRRPCLYLDADGTELLVEFSIREGVQTLIEGIDIEGNTPSIFTSSELLRTGKLRFGQPFNEYFIRDAADLVLEAYQEKGYMFSNVAWETSLSDDQTTAQVTIRIDEGPVVRVNNILVSSDKTSKWFIRDNLGFKSGDLITPSVLNEARQRVMDLGVFNSATVQMQSPGIVGSKKNIVVTVVERNSQYLELRAGVATEQGVRGGFEYGHRNIFGLAINYRLKIRANYRPSEVWFFGTEAKVFREDLNNRYAVYNVDHPNRELPSMLKWFEWYLLTGFRTANIPGTSGLLGTGVDVTVENVNRRGFSALKMIPRYRLTSHYLKFLPIEMYTGLDATIVLPSQNTSAAARRATSSFRRLPSGRAFFWVTGLSVALDFRDSPLDPRDGVFMALKGEHVNSLDVTDEQQENVDAWKSRYIRFVGSISGYLPFIDKRNVIALSATVGYIFHLREDSIAWADRYFYMGGVSTLRGFRSDTMRPEDIRPYYEDPTLTADANDDADAADANADAADTNAPKKLVEELGGEAMFLLRAELRHDFGNNIVGVLFGEAGNLWRDTENFLVNYSLESARFRLRPTVGAGFHYNTPVGPLAFDVGINLDRNKYLTTEEGSSQLAEDLWAWYFSIGSAF